MPYDLIIRGGKIADGTGNPCYWGDLGIAHGVITDIGDLRGIHSKEIIDAEDLIVAPGFIDGHTHMDAQVFWDHLGTNSCWHGVTSVVMGNCGFTLAPCAEKEKSLVLHNLERAEDISPEAMNAGINWCWEHFSEYFDAVDALPKGLNYAGFIGHSAIRTYAMGKRAMNESATNEDLLVMQRELDLGLKAGAIGFSTSRTQSHRTPEGKPVASRLANWKELKFLASTMKNSGNGVMQIARENTIDDPELRQIEFEEVKTLALEIGVPVTFGNTWYRPSHPDIWRQQILMVDEISAKGGRVMMQGTASWNGSLRSFETMTPYDEINVWREFRKLPLSVQKNGLLDPDMRSNLVKAVHDHKHNPDPSLPNALQRPVDWDWVFPLEKALPPYRSIGEIARERNIEEIEVFLNMALEKDLKQFFVQPSHNQDQNAVIEMIRHPKTAVTFSDAGAHVATTINPIHGHLLGHWVRNEQAIELEMAIRKITFEIARFWGLQNRGLLKKGAYADITIFNPKTITPGMPELVHDLPAGAPRIKQKTDGIMATIVNGKLFMSDNEHTGIFPGRLLRGTLAKSNL